MKKFMLFIISLILFIPSVKALSFCEESEEHKKWSILSEEMKSQVIEPKYCEETAKSSVHSLVGASNTFYSSVDLGLITSVKNQGNTNACWAFAGASLMETSAIMNGLTSLDLSERHINMMSTYKAYLNGEVNKSGYNRDANDGGNYSYVASYLFRGDGPLLESTFPYILPWSGNYAPIDKKTMPANNPILTIDEYMSDYTSLTCTDDRLTTIKGYIRKYGAVGTLINSSSGTSSLDEVYYINTTNEYSDHAVVIVGYDDTISKDNFKGATRDGAFLVKNSWGTDFALNGYYYISYDDIRICRNVVAFSGTNINEYDHTYNSSDTLANTSIRSNDSIMVSTKINITGSQILDKISIEVIKDTPYQIYLSKNNDLNTPSSWNILGSGISASDGVISIKNLNIKLSSSATIIVKFNKSGYVAPLMCKSTNEFNQHHYMEISSGLNYINNGSGWVDLSTIGSGTLVSCEPVIYAYTYNENKAFGSIDNIYISSSSNKVYTNSNDYFNVDFKSSNLKSNELISVDITKDGKSVKNDFDIDRSKVNNNYFVLKLKNSTKSGHYTVYLKYSNSTKSIDFDIYDRISSSIFNIDGEYIKILPKKDITLTKEYILDNIISQTDMNVKRNEEELVDKETIKSGDKLTTIDSEYTIILIGDANMDGKISALDYVRIKNHILGNKVMTDKINLLSADANEDGKITPLDYVRIKNRILRGEV